ncbi:3'(2'), 5'-bisphosphate nucleotidase [Saonia flava]|uniref:3'(2'),5'-bisphosphate nucleotidase CysQ n=1 Tax=Saonia flava TaxID=523696 RepID=A0A846R290_9FLAO|nr:3'(2'),5'-bisphosphate nucleotidase CysQ [Saonia flava]NJB71494.1 3'(2'), 5'-bisphosphate nucleotidase [Saonia flava]
MKKSDSFLIAIKASIEAGKSIMELYEQGKVKIESKEDNSPLTAADTASNNVIIEELKGTNIPIISEENKQISYIDRKDWPFCWIVDPLDGTKEFIKRNGEFTVNIALVQKGVPILGVIYVPVTRELYYSDVKQEKAYKTVLNKEHILTRELFDEKDRIIPTISKKNDLIKVVGSRSHMNQDTEDFIKNLRMDFNEVEIVSKGSSLKFCLIAEGRADVYPRFAPTMEWDTAAGHAICSAVGLKVISKRTNSELKYNKDSLLNDYFVVRK